MNEQQLQSEFKETLSQTERRVLMLHYCDRQSNADIGLLLDLSALDVGFMLTQLRRRARTICQVASLEHGSGRLNGGGA